MRGCFVVAASTAKEYRTAAKVAEKSGWDPCLRRAGGPAGGKGADLRM